MDTELMIKYFEDKKLLSKIDVDALQDALRIANEIFI
jgi:hypothetical protein